MRCRRSRRPRPTYTLCATGPAASLPAQLLAAARRLKAPLATAQAGVTRARDQIHAVDPSGLFGPVRSGVDEFSQGLDTLSAELASLVAADNAVLKGAASVPAA